MPTTYTNGLKLPDLGSIDWYNSYKNNIDILDPIVGTVNGVATTYAPISHNHSASEITSGTIDIARLPPAALERLHIVADQTARYALTTSTVQEGDTVKQTDTGVMYLVVDSTKLNSADGYTEYSAGTASKAIADEDGTSIKTGYVNVAGNQTVSGQKTWTNTNTYTNNFYFKDSTVVKGTAVTSDRAQNIWDVTDSNDVSFGTWQAVQYSNNRQGFRLAVSNNYLNGALDPTGTSIPTYFQFLQTGGSAILKWNDGFVDNNILPIASSNYSLGSAYFQWSSVYAQSYYYNGTQWGLDKANTWTNTNTFQQNITYERTNFFHQAVNPSYILKDTGVEKGSLVPTAHTAYPGLWQDKNNNILGYVRFVAYDTGKQTAEIRVSNLIKNGALDPTGSTVNCTVKLELQPSGEKSLIPEQNNDINLGTSTNKWKSFNGINPGALSLPDASNAISLDTTNVHMDGTYTYLPVSVNGWLYIALKDTTCKTDGELTFYIGDSGTSSAYAKWATNFVCSTDGYVRCFIPVLASSRIRIRVNPNGGSPTGLTMTIYPCLGNV